MRTFKRWESPQDHSLMFWLIIRLFNPTGLRHFHFSLSKSKLQWLLNGLMLWFIDYNLFFLLSRFIVYVRINVLLTTDKEALNRWVGFEKSIHKLSYLFNKKNSQVTVIFGIVNLINFFSIRRGMIITTVLRALLKLGVIPWNIFLHL